MLVLTRKIGQQLVLPAHGITIDVVDIGKSRVRLGVSAPAGIPVHRREVWERVRDEGNAAPGKSDSPPECPRADRPENSTAPSPSCPDIGECLARWITKRTGGRISELSVETLDGQVVVHGSTRSYYVRQLAQAAVNEVLNACDHLSGSSVVYDIDVAHVYWRSAGQAQGLTRLPPAQS